MHMRLATDGIAAILVVVLVGCSQPSAPVIELKKFPLDNLDGVITQSGVQLDKDVSSDGNGSVRATVAEMTVVRLFELGDIDLENARLI